MKTETKVLAMCSLAVSMVSNAQGISSYTSARLESNEDIVAIFPSTVADITLRVAQAIEHARTDVHALVIIPDDQRTFANTAKALDNVRALSDVAVLHRVLEIITMVSPDAELREVSKNALHTLEEFQFDEIFYNTQVYHAFKAYVEGNARTETLTDQERYFLQETMQEFVRAGLNLPDTIRAQIIVLEKELALLAQQFQSNISADTSTITVSYNALLGLDQDFIAQLKRSDDGDYMLGVDYPTYFNVMENCSVQETRKQLCRAFGNRAYPANDLILKEIIVKRDELANLLGFADYAHYNLDKTMARKPAVAQQFLDEIMASAAPKMRQEFDALIKELPDDVTLTADGKMYPWNMAYVKELYKKKHFVLDERVVAQYFPMDNTIKQLLDIYRQFLNLEFKEIPVSGLWHEDVKRIDVVTKHGQQLGTLLLDLYPRAHKYSHACHAGIMPATYDEQGNLSPKLSLVIANFPKPTADNPSLLRRTDVITFFHEFGHALHSILGRTKLASFAGTSVKMDFVEMPSKMLEEWLWDAQILKKVSSHVKTGEPLSDSLIAQIQKVQYFNVGERAQRTAFFAKLALALFTASSDTKDPHTILRSLHDVCMPHIYNDTQDHMYASFGHLTGYGARYYGYLWAEVFALDLFSEIKKYGLLNSEIGERYVAEILSKGGSQDPNILLKNFLGREPNAQAFFTAFSAGHYPKHS